MFSKGLLSIRRNEWGARACFCTAWDPWHFQKWWKATKGVYWDQSTWTGLLLRMSLACGGRTSPIQGSLGSQIVNQGSLKWGIKSNGTNHRVFKDVEEAVMIQRHTSSRKEFLPFFVPWTPLAIWWDPWTLFPNHVFKYMNYIGLQRIPIVVKYNYQIYIPPISYIYIYIWWFSNVWASLFHIK